MGSISTKEEIMRRAQAEFNTANVRHLMEKMNENCFEKCVPKPGSSVSSSEQTCYTNCMEKYMSAWNHVNSTYIQWIKREQSS